MSFPARERELQPGQKAKRRIAKTPEKTQ